MIKISSFSSDINRKMVLSERNKAFLSEIEKNLGERIIPADISDYDADLKLIFMTPKIMFMKESTEGIKEGQTNASLQEIEPYTAPANLKEEVYGKSYALEEELRKAKEREKRSGKRNKRRKRR